MAQKKILLIRPITSSQEWAQLLAARGLDCVIEPLVRIEPTHASRPCDTGFDGLLLTSANAIPFLPADLADLPCYVVGASTAKALAQTPFHATVIGHGHGVDLAHDIIASPNPPRYLLHAGGEVLATALYDILGDAGIAVTPWPVYCAIAATDLSPTLCMALENGKITAIPVFSPRSAQILSDLVQQKNLTAACARITVVALSAAVADKLPKDIWQRIIIAASPCVEAVLACLEEA